MYVKVKEYLYKMFRFFYFTLIAATVVYGIPYGCSEDNQCSNGYFCEQTTHFCRECLRCSHLGRNEPQIFKINCIRSGSDCGLCFNGLVYYNGNIDAKCVPTEELNNVTIQIYILSIGILISLLIVVIFIKVLRNTDFIQITYTTLTRISSTNYNKMDPGATSVTGCKK